MALFYADENFRRPVVLELRKLGHDVLTCVESGRAGQKISDEDVLSYAVKLKRIVLTQDHDDFRRLHMRKLDHVGIVTCSYDPDARRLAQRIHEEVAKAEVGGRFFIRVVRPNA